MLNPTQESGGHPPAGGAAKDTRSPALRRVLPPRRRRAASREPTLAELTWTLAERRWTIVAVLVSALVGGAAFLLVARPVYEASVLVQVEGRAKPAAPEDVVQLFDTNPPAEAEMRLLSSRALLGDVVDALGLDVEAAPRRLPVVGDAVARLREGRGLASPPLALRRFGWGGERIALKRLEVSPALLGEPLVLVALDDDAFEVRAADGGAVLASGVVGTPASGGSGDRTVSLLVSELVARPGTEFTLKKNRRDELVERLQKALEVTEQGKPGGLVEVKLSGGDPALIARFVEALATTYVGQSLGRTSAEAAALLRTVEGRLPTLKADLDTAEAALTRFHQRNASVNLTLDAQRLLTRVNELEHAIGEAQLAEADRARRHTGTYPELAAPADTARRLRDERTTVEAQIAALPALELQYARLTRAVAVATERYTHLLNRAEELRTAKASWIGNARVMEHAVEPRRPVSPKRGLVMALAALLGLAGGLGAAFVRSAFDEGVRDPGDIEARTRLPVLATIPRSETQRRLGRLRRGARLDPLAVVDPGDAAVEELRALRTGVEFALARAPNHVVAIGSAGPGAGKSFVTVNLAHLLAAPDARVLVVDADLRRGLLHRYFGLDAPPGLSDVLSGAATLDAALRRTDRPNVDLLPSGGRVTNPAELLTGERLRRLLDEVAGRYGVVVVDTPPLLSVTDGALVARHAGVNLLVVRSGEQTAREIGLAAQRLARNGIQVSGAVLNDVRPTFGRYGRSGRYRYYDTRPA